MRRPGSYVNTANIRASDTPAMVVQKLDAAFEKTIQKGCDCYENVNEKLGSHNTSVASYFTLDETRVGRPWPIETRQLERGRGKPKALALFASFCPICGMSLRKPIGGTP